LQQVFSTTYYRFLSTGTSAAAESGWSAGLAADPACSL
jgi:hypothetical protein